MRKFFQTLLIIFFIILIGGILMSIGGVVALFAPPMQKVEQDSILALNLDGIILNGDEFLEQLRKHRKDDRIKGVLVSISSPGGVVGPSQELFMELKKTHEEYKKPVVVSCGAMMASERTTPPWEPRKS